MKYFKKIAAGIFFLALTVTITSPFVAIAANPPATTPSSGEAVFYPLTQLPGISEINSANGLPDLLNQIYKICIGIGAVLAVLMIMWAGVEFMTGRGSVAGNEKAKSHLQNAILGLVLLLSPFLVFSVINPDILNLKLDFSKLGGSSYKGSDDAGGSAGSAAGTTAGEMAAAMLKCQDYSSIQSIGKENAGCPLTKGYEQIDNATCCSTNTSGICCGVPKDPTKYQWQWKMAVQKTDGTGRYTETQGPFQTQQACTASFSTWNAANPDMAVVDGGIQCNCDKPRSQYAKCAN